jgi:hypothetical protein
MSLPTPSLPPQVPTRSLVPVVLVIAGGLVFVGLLVVWKLTQSNEPAPEAKKAAPAAAAQPAPAPAVAPAPEPPPPPPPEEEPARPAVANIPAAGPAPAKRELTPRAPVKRDPNCDDPCNGRETPQLLSALGAKAGQARSCYEKALSNNSALAGRLEIGVRVSRTGAVCSASVGKDGLGNASVASCVLSRFRGGTYPQPTGGCVDVAVPLNFMPAGSR